jgi:HEAT repeat protein
MHLVLVAFLLLSGPVRLFADSFPPATKEAEAKLIAVLKSEASHKEKVDACRQLAVIGTKEAIGALAALLGDEKLSHMARYGLEPIPDPAVDEALRDALGKVKGGPLVGVIGSIGVRRDAKAVGALTKMLNNPDREVARAAARALGSIGNTSAATALQSRLARASAQNSSRREKLHVCEGLLRCAEALAADGRRDRAIEIYDQLCELDAPHQVRGGALRGAILARGKDGVALLRKHLRSDDYILFSAACQTALEMPGAGVTEALTAELDDLPPDNQILVLRTLGKRADPAVLPALFALARSGKKTIRLEAIRALPQIGDASAVPVLVELLHDTDHEIAQAAQESLAALPGEETDAVVMAMLDSRDASQQFTAIQLMGRRRMTTATGPLLKTARSANRGVRSAAIKMIGELGSPAQLPALLDMFMDLRTSEDLDAARQALSNLCAKTDAPQSCVKKLVGALKETGPAQKAILFRVLAGVGGFDALQAVCTWVGDSNPQVHAAAIRALSSWKDADAAPILLRLAKKVSSPSDKALCLRGYLGYAARPDLPTNQRLSMCQQAVELIERTDEKKLLLGALGSIESPKALELIVPHLNDPEARQEAGMAVVTVAEKLLKRRNASKFAPELIEPLEKVVQATGNNDLSRRAKRLLRQAKSKAGKK